VEDVGLILTLLPRALLLLVLDLMETPTTMDGRLIRVSRFQMMKRMTTSGLA
jgi:hypothetical protein